MGFDYSGLARTALAQIDDKGRSISVVYKTEGTLDIDNDAVGDDSESTVVLKGLVTSFNQSDIDGTMIRQEDVLVLVAASGVTKPRTADVIIDGSNELTVVNVGEIKPGSTAVLYKIQARG